jgi:plasmid stability protein
MQNAPMPTLQIRDLPDDVYHGIAAAARAEHRSLSQQAVVELRRALGLAGATQRRKRVVADLAASGRRLPAEAPTPEALLREDREQDGR